MYDYIMIDENEGYWYPSHDEENRRVAEFWNSPCNAEDGGLLGRRTKWEERATRFIQEQAFFIPLPPRGAV